MASLGVLAGGVAHELNNPLGGIIGITQLLLDDLESEEQLAQDLTIINNAAVHCAGIVKNLLSFARKGGEQKREALSVPDLVDDVMALVGHLFRRKVVEVKNQFAPDFPALTANGQQMKQVMLNLLTNALQAMSGPGQIWVRGSRDESGRLVVEVEDEGPGIKPEVADKIFDPFFTTKPEGEGTGLGLSICYQIVRDHGGSIEVRSGARRGAVIRMIFPPDLAANTAPAPRGRMLEAATEMIYDLQAGREVKS
jgi:two-component system NtrC family sensor kinase